MNDSGENGTEQNTEVIVEEGEVPKVNTELENLLKLSAVASMNDLLSNLKYSWIKVNRKGPESVEGLLVDSSDQHLVLAVDNEILRISTYHIKNFSVNTKTSKEEPEEKKDSKEDSKNSKDESKDKSSEQNDNDSNEQNTEDVSEAQKLFEERLKVAARKRNRRIRKNALQNKKK